MAGVTGSQHSRSGYSLATAVAISHAAAATNSHGRGDHMVRRPVTTAARGPPLTGARSPATCVRSSFLGAGVARTVDGRFGGGRCRDPVLVAAIAVTIVGGGDGGGSGGPRSSRVVPAGTARGYAIRSTVVLLPRTHRRVCAPLPTTATDRGRGIARSVQRAPRQRFRRERATRGRHAVFRTIVYP